MENIEFREAAAVQNPYESSTKKPDTGKQQLHGFRGSGLIIFLVAVAILFVEVFLDLMLTSGGRREHPFGDRFSTWSNVLAGSISMLLAIYGMYLSSRKMDVSVISFLGWVLNGLWLLLVLFVLAYSIVA